MDGRTGGVQSTGGIRKPYLPAFVFMVPPAGTRMCVRTDFTGGPKENVLETSACLVAPLRRRRNTHPRSSPSTKHCHPSGENKLIFV